jgi:hypothetical protein
MLRGLGDANGQDTIFKLGLDCILVDAGREGEGARELADGALRDPILGGVGVLLFSLGVGDLGRSGGRGGFDSTSAFLLVLDSGVVAFLRLLALLGDGTAHLSVLDEARGRCAGSVGAFDATVDEHSLGVDELDVNVLLLHTCQFTVEFVGILDLSNVELGLEGHLAAPGITVAVVASLLRVRVEVVEQAEERVETSVGSRAVEFSREESHCCGCGDGFKANLLSKDAWKS